jgi:putative addiction module component (TIGR02574 family)
MSLTTREIIAAAMNLPPEAKLKLARQLLDNIEPIDQKQIDELWIIEIRRRLDEFEAGKVQTIPADEVFRSLDAKLNRKR